MSKEVNELYKKIAISRELIGKVIKNTENKFLKNNYADLNAIMETVDPALNEAGLLFMDRVEEGKSVHEIIDPETGQMISSTLTLHMSKQDSQSYGSAMSYNRRYARLSMLNLQTVDDDGNIASGKTFAKPAQIKRIHELILKTQTDASKFLQYYHVGAVKDLDSVMAEQAEKTLKLKLEKAS